MYRIYFLLCPPVKIYQNSAAPLHPQTFSDGHAPPARAEGGNSCSVYICGEVEVPTKNPINIAELYYEIYNHTHV